MNLPKSVSEVCFSTVGIELDKLVSLERPCDNARSYHVVLDDILPRISCRMGTGCFDDWSLGIESSRSHAGAGAIHPTSKVRKFDSSRWHRPPPRWTRHECAHG